MNHIASKYRIQHSGEQKKREEKKKKKGPSFSKKYFKETESS